MRPAIPFNAPECVAEDLDDMSISSERVQGSIETVHIARFLGSWRPRYD
jgi:hypothetical protein